MGKRIVNLSFWIAFSLWLPVTVAEEDNLYFSGTLVNEPCVLAVEDELVELDFKSVVDKDLYLNGRTGGRPITLRLQNCQLDTGQSMVHVVFSGPESIEPPGLLVLQSADIHGVLVGLETTAGKPLPLNKTHDMGKLVTGENLISFNAYLQGESTAMTDRTIGLGAFYAALNFTISYE